MEPERGHLPEYQQIKMAVDRVGAAVAFWLFPLPSQSESVDGGGWLERGGTAINMI